MHPVLYALARQRVEERLNQQLNRCSDHAARSDMSRGIALHRARTSLGTVLVVAGNRLLVPGVAPSSGQYLEQKAS